MDIAQNLSALSRAHDEVTLMTIGQVLPASALVEMMTWNSAGVCPRDHHLCKRHDASPKPGAQSHELLTSTIEIIKPISGTICVHSPSAEVAVQQLKTARREWLCKRQLAACRCVCGSPLHLSSHSASQPTSHLAALGLPALCSVPASIPRNPVQPSQRGKEQS